jgi:hypothetical protein
MKKSRTLVFGLVAVLAGAIALACSGGDDSSDTHATHQTSDAAASFRQDMRAVWEDHVTWTRLVIVSFAHDLPDADLTAQRLLKNQADIGNAIKPFYGDEAGTALTNLLREHILVAADLLAAAKSGDQSAAEAASARWYANADEIAVFLSTANPDSWPEAEMKDMMRSHLDLTLKEAVARLQGDFAGDIAAYDEVRAQILHMADMLAEGIINQFPERFA